MTHDIATIRRHFAYDPKTGALYWRDRPDDDFQDGKYPRQRVAAMWRSKYLGKEALGNTNGCGYKRGPYAGRQCRAHRIVWLLFNDALPDQLDHINGNPADNRIENLRAADPLTNACNRKLHHNNRSGQMGVRQTGNGKWKAVIGRQSRIYLGIFDTFEEAAAARKAAERELDYHPNHGRLARGIKSR